MQRPALDGWLAVLLLAGGAIALLVATVATARRPGSGVLDRDGYVGGWQSVHGGYDVRTGSRWVRGWLHLTYSVARPLAVGGVSPNAVTAWNVLLTLGVVAAAAGGGRWPLLAAVVLVAAGLGDSLDGAVAVLQGRATRWGYVLDSAVDRANDLLALAALVVVGAPGWLAVACGTVVFLLEYVRARAANAGADEIGVVTVGERPNRILFSALGLAAAGIDDSRAAGAATAALALLSALSLIGLVQLTVAVRRQLTRRTDELGDDLG